MVPELTVPLPLPPAQMPFPDVQSANPCIVPVALRLKEPVDRTLKLVVEALVIVPLVDQKLVAVRFVDEALVIVPLVDQKLVIVPLVVEAFLKMELPETVKSPPR